MYKRIWTTRKKNYYHKNVKDINHLSISSLYFNPPHVQGFLTLFSVYHLCVYNKFTYGYVYKYANIRVYCTTFGQVNIESGTFPCKFSVVIHHNLTHLRLSMQYNEYIIIYEIILCIYIGIYGWNPLSSQNISRIKCHRCWVEKIILKYDYVPCKQNKEKKN